ncbi:MAG: PhoX family protein [Xanthomonadales bacterium]|nr:PhoX family protein [Xanthomonadales bacterium]
MKKPTDKHSPARRRFLRQSAVAAGFSSLPLSWQAIAKTIGSGRTPLLKAGYGELFSVADQRTGLELLRLPKGFSYTSFSWAGEIMDDGNIVPMEADGMGVVREDGEQVTLVRNHELDGRTPLAGNPEQAYDNMGGGTTTLVFNQVSGKLERSWLSLSGTVRNCAGGVTPWGTWLSCEEACYDPEMAISTNWLRRLHWKSETAEKTHGWVFEVPAEGIAKPEPLYDMGQFNHEACAVDPHSGMIYQTEDMKPKAGFYRFIPNQKEQLQAGGKLQMMRIADHPDMRRGFAIGTEFDVQWVDIKNPRMGHSPGTHDGSGVVKQGLAAGGSAFLALEGCFYYQGQVFFTAKMGGAAYAGQVFCYNPETKKLTLIFESPSHRVFSGPDNLAVSPRGNIVICEDHVTKVNKSQHLLALLESGDYFYFCQINPELRGIHHGHDLAATLSSSEWAGVSFSADGRWMFANLFNPGITVAITGPWVDDLA